MNYNELLNQLFPPVSYNRNGEKFNLQNQIDGNLFKRIDNSNATIVNVIQPNTSERMISDWERVVGIKTDLSKNYSERVRNVMFKINETGGLSIQYFIRLAESIGYRIEIQEFSPYQGQYPDNFPDVDDRNTLIFVWKVKVSGGNEVLSYFTAGSSVAGDRLLEFGDPIIEEFFNDLKPAHTFCYFAYIE
ncbi:hypothetical protein CEP49_06815 [Mergibacter septicus]|uniref:YmfQ family protein n=1 Tax=Mergibacter septicus TaxID=221402 RepID=UPI0011795B7F|nr:putative phage tail protein [Mergibacter septicus]AWX14280.1 hypothetical protein CEP49_06815 [Mergibacter septicus]